MANLADLIDEKLEVTVKSNPSWFPKGDNAQDDEWMGTANHYLVTFEHKRAEDGLVKNSEEFTTEFHTGSAWTRPPTPAEVLSSVLSDVEGIEFESFEGWAANYGFDEDSRKAERIYKAIREQAYELKRLLGDEYEEFAQAERDD